MSAATVEPDMAAPVAVIDPQHPPRVIFPWNLGLIGWALDAHTALSPGSQRLELWLLQWLDSVTHTVEVGVEELSETLHRPPSKVRSMIRELEGAGLWTSTPLDLGDECEFRPLFLAPPAVPTMRLA